MGYNPFDERTIDTIRVERKMAQEKFLLEIKRKLFHLATLFFPLVYFFIFDKENMVIFLTLLCLFVFTFDYLRRSSEMVRKISHSVFQPIMRESESEEHHFTGISYLFLGILLSAIVFPKNIAIASWIVLAICDPAAAITGMIAKSESNQKNGKTYLGFFTFLILAMLICVLYFEFILGIPEGLISIFLVCLVTALFEYYSKVIHLNDNLGIPLSFCSMAYLLGF